jgi:hypothetical protein
MIAKFNSLLMETAPFILLAALVFGFCSAWLAIADIIPILKQVWRPSGSAQSYGIVAGCLSLVVMAAGGRK